MRRTAIGALLVGLTLGGCSSTLLTGCTDDLQQTLEPTAGLITARRVATIERERRSWFIVCFS